jgi:uncharacterized protein (TIGR03435 family)
MARIFAGGSLIVFAACCTFGQSAAASPESKTAFEVASIKPSDPTARGTRVSVTPGGRFTTMNATLKSLIREAYDVRESLISGGPSWVGTQGYDIEAKGAELGVTEDALRKMTEEQRKPYTDQLRLRLRTLLTDRFQLRVHWETKELPLYELVIAKNGPKFPAAKTDNPNLGLSVRGEAGQATITGNRMPLSVLARTLADSVGRPVLDKTGLTGEFDFKMTYAPDPMQQLAGPKDGGADRPAPAASDGPSLFTALQEQLGLRLEAQRGPVEVLVIDSAEHASAN